VIVDGAAMSFLMLTRKEDLSIIGTDLISQEKDIALSADNHLMVVSGTKKEEV
jgi:hypothetical protein